MTLNDWSSRPEFAAALRKVLESDVFKIATQIVEDFMSPNRLMLSASDSVLGDKPLIFLGQIKGFEMRKVAYEALAGDVVKSQQLEAQYGVKEAEILKEAQDAAAAAQAPTTKTTKTRKKP